MNSFCHFEPFQKGENLHNCCHFAQQDGKPSEKQAFRTKDDGRALIAKSALTTLDIGKNDSGVAKSDLLLSRLESISIYRLSPQEWQRIERALSKF